MKKIEIYLTNNFFLTNASRLRYYYRSVVVIVLKQTLKEKKTLFLELCMNT